MNRLRSITLVIISTLFAFSSAMASETLLNHVQLTSQAMSALYMKGLSGGSKKYQREFERYKQQSMIFLFQYIREGGENGDQLLQKWKRFSNKLTLKFSMDYGWEVAPGVRQEFRAYLSDLYQLVEKHKSSYTTPKVKLLLVGAQMEAISARFFDISSTYDGTFSLFSADLEKLNPKTISQEFKTSLANLARNTTDQSIKNSILSAIFKWEFVEESVINYNDKSAYFVVYATKNRIHKVLDQHQSQLSAN